MRALNKTAEAEAEKRARQWSVLALLIIVFTAITSVTPVHAHQAIADMRYMVAALPILAVMIAFCIDRVWAKNKTAGGALLALLLFSNFAGAPFLLQGALCSGNLQASHLVEERFPLFALAREIHRDAPTGIGEARDYLREHAAQDDTILVLPRADSAVLLHYLGDKLIFCCGLPPNASLPKEKIRALGAPAYRGDVEPKWFVSFSNSPAPHGYDLAHVGEAVAYPVHRPEMELHCFENSRIPLRTRIFRRRES